MTLKICFAAFKFTKSTHCQDPKKDFGHFELHFLFVVQFISYTKIRVEMFYDEKHW